MNWLIPSPVVLPLLGAALCLVLTGREHLQRAVTLTALGGGLAASGALLWVAQTDGMQAVVLAGWPAELGIALVADRLSALMLVISGIVTLAVMLFAIGQGLAGGDDNVPVSVFHPTYLVLAAGVSNAFLAGDLFNLFVGFEMLLVSSYVLLTVGGTLARVRSGMTYVVVSLLSSVLFLTGIALVYTAAGTLNMGHLHVRLAELPTGTAWAIQLVLLLAFGMKAAMFPLSAWLPDSYPTASAPVTAVFAGLLTKVGVYAIIRLQTLLFSDNAFTGLLLTIGILTMVVGILGAIAQNDVKRMVSFTLVSHIGYMIFGIGLASRIGLGATIFYAVHHITVQTTLFLAVGLMERMAGTTDLDRLGGLAKASPLLAVLFFVPAMSLAGIPPLSGFFGKIGLFQAGIAEGGWLALAGVGAGALTGLLTLYAVARTWSLAFWGEPKIAAEPAQDGARTLPGPMVLAGVTMLVVTLALTVLAAPLYSLSDAAAADSLQPAGYSATLFPGGAP